MTDDEMISIIQAHKQGKAIQVRDGNPTNYRNWCDMPHDFGFNFNGWEYRIKPEPREFTLLRRGSDGYARNLEVRFGPPRPQLDEANEADEQIHVREVLE